MFFKFNRTYFAVLTIELKSKYHAWNEFPFNPITNLLKKIIQKNYSKI